MGEAKRRGDFESRRRQAIQNAEWEAAKRKVEQADREAAERINGTCAKRSKRSLALAVAAMIAATSVAMPSDR